jgi:hypothetical protein
MKKSIVPEPSDTQMILIQASLIAEQQLSIKEQRKEIAKQQKAIANLVGGEPGSRLPDPWW